MLSVVQLRQVAQFVGATGYASATKKELIARILDYQDPRSPIVYMRGDGKVDVSERVNMQYYLPIDKLKYLMY